MTQRTPEQHNRLMQAEASASAGAFAEALHTLETLHDEVPHDTDVRLALARCLSATQSFDAAAAHCRGVLEQDAASLVAYEALVRAYQLGGRFDQALQAVDAALDVAPGQPVLTKDKVELLHLLGRYDDAFAVIQDALDAWVVDPAIVYAFARIAPFVNRTQQAIELTEKTLTTAQMHPLGRLTLLFALGQLRVHQGNHDEAFRVFKAANDMAARGFDEMAFVQSVDDTIARWTPEAIADLPHATVSTDRVPVFIIGMHRSGTSLLDQMLASHPDVFGLGEAVYVDRAVESLAGSGKTSGLATLPPVTDIDQQAIDGIASQYLEAATKRAGDLRVIVDKMHTNFRYLGLLHAAFPTARFVHIERDPRDTAVSIFFHAFRGVSNRWAYDLRSIGVFYREYERLMDHWRRVLPDLSLIEVEYEALVREQEATIRAVTDFIGLEWNDAVLRYYEADRVTHTASQDQVRKPVYESSIGRWKHYERHLGPFLSVLNDA